MKLLKKDKDYKSKRLPYSFSESLGYEGREIDEDKALKILNRVGVFSLSDLNETPLMVVSYVENINILNIIIKRLKESGENLCDMLGDALICACESRRLETIKTLIESGADIEYIDNYNQTPLSKIFTNTFSDPLPSAKYLISKGAEITDMVLEMGTQWDSKKFALFLDSIDYKYDKSIIGEDITKVEESTFEEIDIVDIHFNKNGENYRKTASIIWKKLVPRSGQAESIQGELLRAVEKIADEAQRNGNGNFHQGCHGKLIKFLKEHLIDVYIFSKTQLEEIKRDILLISKNSQPYTEDDVYDRLTKRVVDWYIINPKLIVRPIDDNLDC